MKTQLKTKLALMAMLLLALNSVGKSQFDYVGRDSAKTWKGNCIYVDYRGNDKRIKKDAHALCQYFAMIKRIVGDGEAWDWHDLHYYKTGLDLIYFPENDGIVHTNGGRVYQISISPSRQTQYGYDIAQDQIDAKLLYQIASKKIFHNTIPVQVLIRELISRDPDLGPSGGVLWGDILWTIPNQALAPVE